MALAADLCDDTNIRELLKSGNHKQALKNVDKKLKKKPNAIDLFILQAAIQYELANYEKAAQVARTLVAQNPPKITADHISPLYDLICLLGRKADGITGVEALWKKIIQNTSPRSLQLKTAQSWASLCLQHRQWQHLQKASSLLQTLESSAQPAHRRYIFLELVAWVLAARDDRLDDRKRSLYMDLGKRRALAVGAQNGKEWADLHGWTTTAQEDAVIATMGSEASSKCYKANFSRVSIVNEQNPDLGAEELFRLLFGRQMSLSGAWVDMRAILELLDKSQASQFLDWARRAVDSSKPAGNIDDGQHVLWVIAETNILNLQYSYLLQYSTTTTPDTLSDDLQTLACSCIRLYGISRSTTIKSDAKDIPPGNEICILAVKILKKAADIRPDQTISILLYLLLKHAMVDSDVADSRIRLGLLDASVRLGLFQAAIDAYKTLNVKELLVEPLSPRLFFHLSSWHPYAPKGDPEIYHLLQKSLQFYDVSLQRIPKFQNVALELGNPQAIIDINDLFERLFSSPTRVMLILEYRRFVRLFGTTTSNAFPLLQRANSDYLDRIREAGVSTVLTSINSSMPEASVDLRQLKMLLFMDFAYECCTDQTYLDSNLAAIKNAKDELSVVSGSASNGVHSGADNDDRELLQLSELAYGLILLTLTSKAGSEVAPGDFALQVSDTIGKFERSVEGWQTEVTTKSQVDFVDSSQLKHLYWRTEFCFALIKVLRQLPGWLKTVSAQKSNTNNFADVQARLAPLQARIRSLKESWRLAAQEHRDHLGAWKVRREVLEPSAASLSAVTEEAVKVIGPGKIKYWLDDIFDSAAEAFNGYLSVDTSAFALLKNK